MGISKSKAISLPARPAEEEGSVNAKKVLSIVGAVAMAGMLSASMAYSKACPALCKDVIKECKLGCTTKPKAKCKRTCKKNAVNFCKENNKTCPTSVSGAFLAD